MLPNQPKLDVTTSKINLTVLQRLKLITALLKAISRQSDNPTQFGEKFLQPII